MASLSNSLVLARNSPTHLLSGSSVKSLDVGFLYPTKVSLTPLRTRKAAQKPLVVQASYRLRISHNAPVFSKHCCCIVSGNSGITPESSNAFSQESSIDIKLPRRSLLVQFTCNACGERTKRLINRVAYERGTVFVQCSGCLKHHKLVDNLGLVVEYDFRDDNGEETED